MRVDSASLKTWLVEQLDPISDSDPSVLADYVLVLLEKDQPDAALQQRCRESLLELLKDETEGFVDRLFDTLHTDSYLFTGEAKEAEEAEEVEEAEEKDDDDAATDDAVGISSERSLGRAAVAESDDDDDDEEEDRNYKRRRRPERDEPAAEAPRGGRRNVPGPGDVPEAKQQRRSHTGGAPAASSAALTVRRQPVPVHHVPHHAAGPPRHPPMMGG